MISEYSIKDGFYQYDVYYFDAQDLTYIENENQRKEYAKRFEDGLLISYGVVKRRLCFCCDSPREEVDSLWDIHAENAEEAFKYYLKY